MGSTSKADKPPLSYRDAGVDIAAGEEAVDRIKALARRTHGPNVLANLGGFGGLFRFPRDQYRNPVLVSSTDGVGTKLKIAFLTGRHDTIGQDLVNHCVNDILTTGAQPLFFLDYFATSRLDGEVFESVVRGLALACEENECALIGGETAEMPDFYQPEEYDISGTIVGVVEKDAMLTGLTIDRGDVLVGLPSTGLHTNGFSLARKALLREWTVDSYVPELDGTVGEVLLTIHRSYLHVMRPLLQEGWLKGTAHITGGGIEGNLGRLLRDDLHLVIDWDAWDWPSVFKVIQQVGNVPTADMRRTFNLGIGWVLVISQDGLESLRQHLSEMGETSMIIGEIQ
ncbi:MAG: phosphoribosylformylglycinamidine cyclo-ligase [Fidelibacterota bacterium]|nr:MAG: phosphoribosylformylglycinamidine cyclo-ligase [Candidatus Neomarinimicrobiota bacterium]